MATFLGLQVVFFVVAIICIAVARHRQNRFERDREAPWNRIRDELQTFIRTAPSIEEWEAERERERRKGDFATPVRQDWSAFYTDRVRSLIDEAREIAQREHATMHGSNIFSRLFRGETARDEMRVSQLGMWAFLNLTCAFALLGEYVNTLFHTMDSFQWVGWVFGPAIWLGLTLFLWWFGRDSIDTVERGLRSVLGTRTPWGVYVEGEVWVLPFIEDFSIFSIARVPLPINVDNVRTRDGGEFVVKGIAICEVDLYRLFEFSRIGWDRFVTAFGEIAAAQIRTHFPTIGTVQGTAGPWEVALTAHDGVSAHLEQAIVSDDFAGLNVTGHQQHLGIPDRHGWGITFYQVRVTDIIPQGELADLVHARAAESAQRVRETENNETATQLARQIVDASRGPDDRPTTTFTDAYTLVRQLQLVQEGKGTLNVVGGTAAQGIQAIVAGLIKKGGEGA